MPSGKSNQLRTGKAHGQKDTPELRAKFLDLMRKGKLPSVAAAECGLGRRTVFTWREDDVEFAKAWADAVETGIDILEQEARRRAEVGCLKPVFQGGVQVGQMREYSDTLMSLLLKGRRRDIFNVERHEHTGADGAPIDVVQRTIVRAPPRKRGE